MYITDLIRIDLSSDQTVYIETQMVRYGSNRSIFTHVLVKINEKKNLYPYLIFTKYIPTLSGKI